MSYTLLEEKIRTAKKQHKCIWCGQKIIIGDLYLDERSVYDNHLQVHRWHVECNEDAKEQNRNDFEWEFMPGENDRPEVYTVKQALRGEIKVDLAG